MEEELFQQINADKTREYAPAIAFAALVIVFGILGNLMASIFYGYKLPKTPTNCLITCLSVLDLVTCLVLCGEVIELCYLLNFQFVAGCKTMYFLNQWLVMASGSMLLLIATDRFRKICRPLQRQFTMLISKLGFAAVMAFTFVVSLRTVWVVDVVEIRKQMPEYKNQNVTFYFCTMSKDPNLHGTITAFHWVDFIVFVVIIGGTAVLYSFISWTIYKSRSKLQEYFKAGYKMSESTLCNTPMKDPNTSSGVETSVDIERPSMEAKRVNSLGMGSKTSSTNLTLGRREQKRMKAFQIEKKITFMMIIVTVVSLTSFLPHFVINLAIKSKTITEDDELKGIYQFLIRLFMLNNAVNPYIMAICNKPFREFVENTLCKFRKRNVTFN